MHGCCLVCLGLGLILGYCMESWLLCCFGGLIIIGLGLCTMGRR